MVPLTLVKLTALMERTSGSAEVKIGLIDGPVALQHADLTHESLREAPGDSCQPLLCDRCQRLFAAFDFHDFIVGWGQHIADDLAIVRLILDNQNALAHAASTCRSTMTGSVKVNVEPWPG